MYKRQKLMGELKTLDVSLWTKPASKLNIASGRLSLRKEVRTKQWVTGQDVWQGLRKSRLQGMNFTLTWGVTWVDLCRKL